MEVTEIIEAIRQGEGEKVEFKESLIDLGRTICAFANTIGGMILLGVTDEGRIKGILGREIRQKIFDSFSSVVPAPNVKLDEVKIGDKNIITLLVSPSDQLLSYRNIVYIRAGGNNRPLSLSEILNKSAESLKIFWDEQVSSVSVKKINKKLLEDYLSVREKVRGVASRFSFWENAEKLKAIRKKGGRLFLTNAGLLFFTNDPTDYYSFAKVKLVWFEDREMKTYKDTKEFVGPLPKIVGDLEKYWLSNLKTIGGFRTGFKRGEILEYPLFSLREALINALIHRNYFDPSEVIIFVFPDSLEIRNPGSFPPGVTPERPEHKPRNPILSQYMYDLGLTEKYGSGIEKIKKECREHPLIEVNFLVKPFFTRVVFQKKRPEMKLDEVSEKILQIARRGEITSGEIRHLTGLSRQSVVSRMNNLETMGFLKRIGRGRGVRYRLFQ